MCVLQDKAFFRVADFIIKMLVTLLLLPPSRYLLKQYIQITVIRVMAGAQRSYHAASEHRRYGVVASA